MDARTRFSETMRFGKPDRLPYWEFIGFWPQTIERWHQEGLPQHICERMNYEGILEPVPIEEFFDYDRYECVPVNQGLVPAFDEEVFEETDEYVIRRRTDDGCIVKSVKTGMVRSVPSVMDQWLEYAVTDRESFRKFSKRLNAKTPARYLANWDEYVLKINRRDYPLAIRVGSLFGWPRNWIGIENVSMMFYDDPAFMHEIMDFIMEFIIETITPALQAIDRIDFALFWEDMAYNHGSLVSPGIVKEFMMPRYKRITSLLHKHGVDVIFVDCDGNHDELTPLWLESGINGVFPLECAAGEDPVRLRKEYGKDLLLIGGLDKRTLIRGRKEMEAEVASKVPFLVENGGWIPSLDHAVPPDVSFDDYRYYLDTLRRTVEAGV
ncbi:MAG: hypothetical protein HYX78_11720 [Armatimonadetes bacterium]|nr:hypothetical protein [Armatimonadota bacterium]